MPKSKKTKTVSEAVPPESEAVEKERDQLMATALAAQEDIAAHMAALAENQQKMEDHRASHRASLKAKAGKAGIQVPSASRRPAAGSKKKPMRETKAVRAAAAAAHAAETPNLLYNVVHDSGATARQGKNTTDKKLGTYKKGTTIVVVGTPNKNEKGNTVWKSITPIPHTFFDEGSSTGGWVKEVTSKNKPVLEYKGTVDASTMGDEDPDFEPMARIDLFTDTDARLAAEEAEPEPMTEEQLEARYAKLFKDDSPSAAADEPAAEPEPMTEAEAEARIAKLLEDDGSSVEALARTKAHLRAREAKKGVGQGGGRKRTKKRSKKRRQKKAMTKKKRRQKTPTKKRRSKKRSKRASYS